MKKIFFVAILTGLVSLTSCDQEKLETFPTDEVSVEQIFSSADAAQTALNGIYRAMFMNGWSDSWSSENPGIMSTLLFKDLQGEDHLMANQGNGWFYYDYSFGTDADYTHSSGRQYAQWNLYYTIVSQANYVIAQEEKLLSFGNEGKYVLAQGYALRGFAYFWLYNIYCQGNYAENSDTPGVPLYTEPTTPDTKGKGRGTVAEVFTQVNADYKTAVELFTEADVAQKNIMNIDLYATYALWARVALAQEDWDNAYLYATEALKKPKLTRVSTMDELGAFNDISMPSLFWGFEVIADQTGPYGPFMSHMDLNGGYGKSAQQCIDAWLWNNISNTDARKNNWWDNPADPSVYPYAQFKFQYKNLATATADMIYMRAEEMILVAAEAACRNQEYETARNLLKELGTKRDSDYEARLATLTDDVTYSDDTHAPVITLLEEILFQRRVELWSEGMGRAYDLARLNLGYSRDYDGSNHTSQDVLEPGDYMFVTLIPQKEFDSNDSINIQDQNPR
ncbi:MAG: RagB/SusD family nutrient uptake outer membrane protein [Bacteroidaceae bacterium]|nr:RagB/SusD family nutrient uptake outer membrane protein [Bacteroidaceae bacterium]